MFLNELKIKNFRLIKDTTFNFSPGINILIGENNAGKTTVLDVLRICLGYKEQNALRVVKEDFKVDNEFKDIEFDLSFKATEDKEKAYFIELYDAQKDTLDLHFRFHLHKTQNFDRIYTTVWGGKNEGNSIPEEVFHLFVHVYLDALRDAKKYLRPGRYNKLGELFSNIDPQNFSKKYDKVGMINEVNTSLENSLITEFINDVKEEYIDNHLNEIIFNENNLDLKILPISHEFEDLANGLQIKLPIGNDSNKSLEINQNGLGYNNLIYIAILLSNLSDLKKKDDSLFIALCIEEPESHLQPQLQNLLFKYLNKLNKELNESRSFQVFISSHSPTLTAKADLDSITILQKSEDNIVNLNLKDANFSDDNKIYLHKFLDVTKSQLLFSKKVIFVEGISEALLIPIFVEKLSKELNNPNYDLEKNGVEIVIAQGLTFKHFAPLFDKDNKLVSKAVILTDDDRKEIDGEKSNTCNLIEKLENPNLKVCVANKTFEYELLCCNGEGSVIWNTFKNKHKDLFKTLNSKDKNGLFDLMDKQLKKSEIAWQLSIDLDSNSEFKIPPYIKDALKFIFEE